MQDACGVYFGIKPLLQRQNYSDVLILILVMEQKHDSLQPEKKTWLSQ